MKWWDREEVMPAAERMAVLAAGALVVWAAWSWVDRAVLPARDTDAAARTEAAQHGAAVLDETLARVNERAVLKPPKPKGFQLQLTAVAGDQAIFAGGQAAGVGGEIAGAKVLAVGPDWAEIEFEGNTQKLYLFGQGQGEGGHGGHGGPGGPGMRPGMRGPGGPGGPGGSGIDPARMREIQERMRARAAQQ